MSTVEEIKSRLNIVDVVGAYLKLEKAGANLKARCPFHSEKTPSFFVSPARDSFHCFGCNKGGDIFEFLKEIEGVEFVDALKILAEKAGVKIKNEDNRGNSLKGRLVKVIEKAVLFFQRELAKNQRAKDYLQKRGLTEKTIEDFKIGFAPDGWRNLYDELKGSGFSDGEIEATGLIIKGDKGYYDRFRSRIMFPLNNIAGVTVGFSGRIFGEDVSGGGNHVTGAKYINSPETLLYNKSKILYGFDRGRVMMRSTDSCILVEGQMDLLMSHQAGLSNTVAVSGTALTEEHVQSIKRLANKLIIAFDGDEAGFKAIRRGIDLALSMGMDVRVAGLSDNIDPADLVLKDKDKWLEITKEAKHIIDFYLSAIFSKYNDSRQIKKEVERLVLPYVASIKSKIEQAHFVDLIARKLFIKEEPIWEELRKIETSDGLSLKNNKQESTTKEYLVKKNNKIETLIERISAIVFWLRRLGKNDPSVIELEKQFDTLVSESGYFLFKKLMDDKEDGLIFEAEIIYSDKEDVIPELRDLILSLQEEMLREKLNKIMTDLKRAESSEDQKEVEKYLKMCQDITSELITIKHLKNKTI